MTDKTDRTDKGRAVGIVGPGRAGLGLGLALRDAGIRVLGVHGRRPKPVPRALPLSLGAAVPWLGEAGVVLLAVRDDSLGPLVEQLRRQPLRRGVVMLHLSGACTSDVLAPLRRKGARVGSMHPLMTVSADPRRASRHFRGATFALEGDAEAVRAAHRIARALGAMPVTIRKKDKARYHAGAVFASNYVVALLDSAQRLLESSGFSPRAARRALAPLTAASVANEARYGPEKALTGPIIRGDAETVRRHLEGLDRQTRAVYACLGLATLQLAKRAGLAQRPAREIETLLNGDKGQGTRGKSGQGKRRKSG